VLRETAPGSGAVLRTPKGAGAPAKANSLGLALTLVLVELVRDVLRTLTGVGAPCVTPSAARPAGTATVTHTACPGGRFDTPGLRSCFMAAMLRRAVSKNGPVWVLSGSRIVVRRLGWRARWATAAPQRPTGVRGVSCAPLPRPPRHEPTSLGPGGPLPPVRALTGGLGQGDLIDAPACWAGSAMGSVVQEPVGPHPTDTQPKPVLTDGLAARACAGKLLKRGGADRVQQLPAPRPQARAWEPVFVEAGAQVLNASAPAADTHPMSSYVGFGFLTRLAVDNVSNWATVEVHPPPAPDNPAQAAGVCVGAGAGSSAAGRVQQLPAPRLRARAWEPVFVEAGAQAPYAPAPAADTHFGLPYVGSTYIVRLMCDALESWVTANVPRPDPDNPARAEGIGEGGAGLCPFDGEASEGIGDRPAVGRMDRRANRSRAYEFAPVQINWHVWSGGMAGTGPRPRMNLKGNWQGERERDCVCIPQRRCGLIRPPSAGRSKECEWQGVATTPTSGGAALDQ